MNNTQRDSKTRTLATGGCLLLFAIGCMQIAGCYVLISDYWGWPLLSSVLVVFILLMFRLIFLISIGSFFGAMEVWGWPWFAALALALPGLVFFVLLVTGALTAGALKSKLGSPPSSLPPDPPIST